MAAAPSLAPQQQQQPLLPARPPPQPRGPGEIAWWRVLSADTLAVLVVDSFASVFCEALLDGAILAVERDEGWSLPTSAVPRLSQSASAPTLLAVPPPRPPPRWQGTPPSPAAARGRELLQLQEGERQSAGRSGFTQSGLPKDGLDAWSMRWYHACKPLESYLQRIERVTEMQRPRRRVPRPPAEPEDKRKFVWPMAATNFPERWEQTTRKPTPQIRPTTRQGSPGMPFAVAIDPLLGGQQLKLLGTDAKGHTVYPYSLAVHKAFLDSQANDKVKDAAQRVAPLKLTSSHYSI